MNISLDCHYDVSHSADFRTHRPGGPGLQFAKLQGRSVSDCLLYFFSNHLMSILENRSFDILIRKLQDFILNANVPYKYSTGLSHSF